MMLIIKLMDQKISKATYYQHIENAYPTYVIGLNHKCFTRCIKIDKPNDSKDGWFLTNGETECVETCSSTYAKMLTHMIANFETRVCL